MGQNATCQHCNGEVEYGTTEHGFRGFVHTATGLSECPSEVEDAR